MSKNWLAMGGGSLSKVSKAQEVKESEIHG